MQREIREFADASGCEAPVVRVTLEDGEQLFLRTLHAGPGEDYVRLSAYPESRSTIVRLDAIRRVDLLELGPTATESTFVFRPRKTGVGFTRD